MKSRNQAKQSPLRGTAIHYHHNVGASILESELELDYLNLRLFNRDFEYLKMQPGSIEFLHNGKVRRYSPDAQSIENGVCYFDEIKYSTEVNKPEVAHKMSVLSEYYASNDQVFRVWTESEIRSGERHKNLLYLSPMFGFEPPHAEVDELVATLTSREIHILDLLEHINSRKLKPCLIRRALALKLLKADLTKKYDDLTIFW
jgi:hypothetical protein